MDDSTPERSLASDDPEPAPDELLTRAQKRWAAQRRRDAAAFAVKRAPDGSYTLAFRFLTRAEAAHLARLSDHARPLSHLAKRTVYRLERTPEVLEKGRRRPPAVTPESAPRLVEQIRAAVAQCRADNVAVTYEMAAERMRPYSPTADWFGEIVRRLGALGHGPWPGFFEPGE